MKNVQVSIIRMSTSSETENTVYLADPIDSKNNRRWNWFEVEGGRRVVPFVKNLLRLPDAEIERIEDAIKVPDTKFDGFFLVDDEVFEALFGRLG